MSFAVKDYECRCKCHTEGFLDCEPCCEGQCPACGKNVTYKKGHWLVCDKLEEFKSKTKRKVLRQLGLLPPTKGIYE